MHCDLNTCKIVVSASGLNFTTRVCCILISINIEYFSFKFLPEKPVLWLNMGLVFSSI